ncbi:MAG: DUF3187 family protein [Nitrospira sp.]|nr:DUF3187 family protein [Nitrospira sp.]
MLGSRVIFAILFVSLALAGGVSPRLVWAEGFGPFPVRNFQPLHQLVLGMPGDRATVLKPGALDLRVELANTANVFSDTNSQASVSMKFESVRSGLFLRYGVTERLEMAVEIPVLYRYQGIMNGMISAVERGTTGLAPDRRALEDTNYAYSVVSRGRNAINARNGAVGLGDASILGKYQVLTETNLLPTISFRAAIKLPTGDESHLLGSGSPDYGFGVAMEKHLAKDWMVYANLNGVIPTGRIAGFELQPVVSALVAVEYLWSENFSIVGHFDYFSSPMKGTGSPVFDLGVTEGVLGFNYRLRPQLLWQVYAVENLDFIVGSAADFTLSTTMTFQFES